MNKCSQISQMIIHFHWSIFVTHSTLTFQCSTVIIFIILDLKQVKYKEDYKKDKGRNFTEIPETNEMVLSKELRPVQSKKLYEEKSKEMLKNVSIPPGLYHYNKTHNSLQLFLYRVYLIISAILCCRILWVILHYLHNF